MTKFILRLDDCVAGMAELPDESIDLVVTSPPYNLGIRYGKFSDRAGSAIVFALVRRMGGGKFAAS